MTALTSRLASARREGVRSVACMEAEASTSTRLWRARAAPAGSAGCSAAATRTAPGQRVHIGALRERGRGELALEPGLGILEAGVPRPVRRDLLGGQQLQHRAFLMSSL